MSHQQHHHMYKEWSGMNEMKERRGGMNTRINTTTTIDKTEILRTTDKRRMQSDINRIDWSLLRFLRVCVCLAAAAGVCVCGGRTLLLAQARIAHLHARAHLLGIELTALDL
eukprot:m.67063 g.67063  ORF g.67063 m.67063 type:complete len:112 (-) comp14088_c2_seq4:3717-4052(-)